MLITLDCGTTNMRLRLTDGQKILHEEKVKIGIRDCAKCGSNVVLKDAIKTAINKILTEQKLKESDVETVIASGMITSSLGLCEIPHIDVPATLLNLKKGAKTLSFPEISAIPFMFIPGVKNDPQNLDMMRGEETEIFGIVNLLHKKDNFIAILPGSHTKIVEFCDNAIVNCHTTLTGEILQSIAENTVLKSSLPEKFMQQIIYEKLVEGCKYALENGFSKAAFHVRAMDILLDTTPSERENFYVGATLCDDIRLIGTIAGKNEILVGGTNPLKDIFAYIIKNILNLNVTVIDDYTSRACTTFGACDIYKEHL